MQLTERHVQALWYDAALRPANLYTRRGSELRVVSPGEWNTGPGPDFRGAILELGPERTRLVGDVEIHLCPADWDFHRHGADPRYRNVIAHVTWSCGPDPKSLPAGAVSVWLGRFVAATFDPATIDLLAYPSARLPIPRRPCEDALAGDPDRARKLLADAGRYRLKMKARRLAGRLAAQATPESAPTPVLRVTHAQASPELPAPPAPAPVLRVTHAQASPARPAPPASAPPASAQATRQLFYEEVMTALGYHVNAAAFRGVAERVPLDFLLDERENAVAALLSAGTFETWHMRGFRPTNRPAERLAKAAELFWATPILEYAAADDFSEKTCREMVEGMRGKVGEDGRRCLGRGRAAAILANVIAPWAMAEGRLKEAPDWLPVEDISEPMRITAFRLFGRDHNPSAYYANNGLLAQGLLHIRHEWCQPTYPDCARCRVQQETKTSKTPTTSKTALPLS